MSDATPKATGKKIGRPPIVIDEAQLFELAKIDCTLEEIAAVMKITKRGLQKKLKNPQLQDIYDRGKQQCRVSLRRLGFRHAMMANGAGVQAWKHLTINVLGWTGDKATNVHTTVENTINVTTSRERVTKKLDDLRERLARGVDGIAVAAGATTLPRETVEN